MKIETLAVQAGYEPGNGEPRNIPIIQSTTFRYESSEQMARLFDLSEAGYFYTRLQNPTNDRVAARICALEGGAAAMLTSSGQAASFYALFNICSAGDHIVAEKTIYGGTYNLLNVTMRRMGIETTFVDAGAAREEIDKAFRPNTKAVFAETLSNPTLIVLDIEKWSAAAHDHGVPLIVDNTFPTPVNCRPFEWGADIITHSTTKYLDGHAVTVGGAIVDSGRFPWDAHPDKYPGLTEPDESYHGVVYTKTFGAGAYITKATTQLMRDLGSIPGPQNAFYLGIGIESLPLRMAKHCENALKTAAFLKDHPKVDWVNFPHLPGDAQYELAMKYMPQGGSGVVTFGIKGGRAEASAFQDALKLCSIATHVADAKTCVLYPAGTTHRQLSSDELKEAGVLENLIRLSVGIENADDIIDDLAQALG
jgi:O-acetylhomoserine (thiol)-lyase